MTIRRLHEIDLARIAPLEADEKRRRLRQQRSGRAPYSYDPARSVVLDVLNAQPSLPLTAARTPWEKIESQLRRTAPSDESFDANVEVTALLHGFVVREGVEAVQLDLGRLPIGLGETVSYWINAAIVQGHDVIVPFFDHRRGKGLTALGRVFAHSMMREHLQARHPDLQAKFGLFQFPQAGEDRSIAFRVMDRTEAVYSFEELALMVNETYRIWKEVLDERVEEARKTGTEDDGLWR